MNSTTATSMLQNKAPHLNMGEVGRGFFEGAALTTTSQVGEAA